MRTPKKNHSKKRSLYSITHIFIIEYVPYDNNLYMRSPIYLVNVIVGSFCQWYDCVHRCWCWCWWPQRCIYTNDWNTIATTRLAYFVESLNMQIIFSSSFFLSFFFNFFSVVKQTNSLYYGQRQAEATCTLIYMQQKKYKIKYICMCRYILCIDRKQRKIPVQCLLFASFSHARYLNVQHFVTHLFCYVYRMRRRNLHMSWIGKANISEITQKKHQMDESWGKWWALF